MQQQQLHVALNIINGCRLNMQQWYGHNITEQVHGGLLPKKEDGNFKNNGCLQLFVEKFIINSPIAPCKPKKWDFKENYVHVIHGPMECNQGVV